MFDIAKKYSGRGIPMQELISEGNMGLIRAIDKFDLSKNVKLITYAVWWIRQAMLEALRRKKLISYVDLSIKTDNNTVIEQGLYDEENTIEETEEFEDYIDSRLNGSPKIGEAQQKVIIKISDLLNDREKDIIENYYGINGKEELTLLDIGKKYNLSSERVRQIKTSAIRKLRSQAMLIENAEEVFDKTYIY